VGPISKDVEEKLLRIKRRAVEAISIINDILKISKLVLLDSIDRTLISITDLIENVIENYSATIEIKKINVLLLDKRKNKINVEGDKTFLELAFSNLIGNAVKYTADEGKIEIIIEDKIGELSVEITDSGIGVPEKDLSSIFNDFYRASNLKKNKIEGTGLGLSVVKQIIDQHNGKISVISPSRLAHGENRGATFKITLPL
jgi:Signal transduction histidine kinase